MYSARVKHLARYIDPGCWKSYSGKSVRVKRLLEARRINALQWAQDYIHRIPVGSRTTYICGELWREPMSEEPARKPWSAWKMKIMLHFYNVDLYPKAACPFLQTVAPTSQPHVRISHYNRVCRELVADGLLEPLHEAGGFENGHYIITDKGRVFAEAVLTTPLPVPKAEWIMPPR